MPLSPRCNTSKVQVRWYGKKPRSGTRTGFADRELSRLSVPPIGARSRPVVHSARVLTSDEVEAFVDDGFVVRRGAVPREIIDACRPAIDAGMSASGVDLDDEATWDGPIVRFECPNETSFGEAAAQPGLWEVYDQLIGTGRWNRHRVMTGTVIARFPHADAPFDTGWHIDGSFDIDDDWWVNVRSRQRGLLCFFLLTDVGPDDSPTEVKVGSHLDVPAMLDPYGDTGTSYQTIAHSLPRSTLERPSVFATGRAGDVMVCHPFLVHRVTWPSALTRPRLVAQVAVKMQGAVPLDTSAASPVERAILRALEAVRGGASAHST